MGRQGRILNCVDSFACHLLRGGAATLCSPRAGRYAAALRRVRVRIAALPVRQGGAAPLARHGRALKRTLPCSFRRLLRGGGRRFARRVRVGMPLLCGGCGCGLLRRPAAQGAVPKGRQGRILNRAFPCGFYRLLRGGGRPLGTREDFFGEKDHADPTPAFAQPYSRSAESKEKAVCTPWRGSVPPFLVGVSKGGRRPPFGTRLCKGQCGMPAGEADGARRFLRLVCSGRKTGRLFANGNEQNIGPVSERGGYVKAPSLALRAGFWTKRPGAVAALPGKVAGRRAAVKAEMNGFAPGLDRRPPPRRPAVPPSRRMGGKGGRFLKGLGRSRSDFGAFFSKN